MINNIIIGTISIILNLMWKCHLPGTQITSKIDDYQEVEFFACLEIRTYLINKN